MSKSAKLSGARSVKDWLHMSVQIISYNNTTNNVIMENKILLVKVIWLSLQH